MAVCPIQAMKTLKLTVGFHKLSLGDKWFLSTADVLSNQLVPQRRIRHITSIQVCNLTPFPARDALASALAQPSEQPQFTSHGRFSDDLDITLSRKRSRRISVNSMNTLRSLRSEEEPGGEALDAAETRGRRRTGSRVSFSSGGSLGRSSLPARSQPVTISPTVRPGNRPRTNSVTSSISGNHTFNSTLSGPPLSASISALPDNSQSGLESVINSRLVETFVAVTVPPSTQTHFSPPRQTSQTTSTHSRPSTPLMAGKDKPSYIRKSHSTAVARLASKSTSAVGSKSTPPSRNLSSSSLRPSSSRPTAHATSPSASASPHLNGRSLPHTPSKQKPTPPPNPTHSSDEHIIIPNFLSRIHHPSTNPSFAIDNRSGREFADWTDLSGEKLKVEVWGKVGESWHVDGTRTYKGKEKKKEVGDEEGDAWKVLEEWDVDLADLILLPREVSCLFHAIFS
jgi:hypothetical protein